MRDSQTVQPHRARVVVALPERGGEGMTCTGLDAVATDLCLKIEHAAKKYDLGFMDVMNRIAQIHCSWEEQ